MRIVCFLLLLPFISSYSQGIKKPEFIIKGIITGAKDSSLVNLYDIDGQKTLDSAIIIDDHFILKGQVEHPATCWIRCGDEYTIIQVENTNMTFTSLLKNMRLNAVCKGGKEQALQNELSALQHPYEIISAYIFDSLKDESYTGEKRKELIRTYNSYQDSLQTIYIDFGKRHPDSYLGLDILYRNRQKIGIDSIKVLLTQMSPFVRSSTKAQALSVYATGELAQKGQRLIDFEVQTTSGSLFRLSSLRGKYVLLSFWSAGCGPCREENRMISADYKRLKDKFDIVSFSLDKIKEDWTAASRADNILWTNVSDLKGDDGKIKTQYDVQAIPTSYLINKNGIIIEKFIGVDDHFISRLEEMANQ